MGSAIYRMDSVQARGIKFTVILPGMLPGMDNTLPPKKSVASQFVPRPTLSIGKVSETAIVK